MVTLDGLLLYKLLGSAVSPGIGLPMDVSQPVDFVLGLIKLTSSGQISWRQTETVSSPGVLNIGLVYEAQIQDTRLVLTMITGMNPAHDNTPLPGGVLLKIYPPDGPAQALPDVAALSGLAVAVSRQQSSDTEAIRARVASDAL